MKYIIALIAVCFSLNVIAQPGVYRSKEFYRKKKDPPQELARFIPQGYEMLQSWDEDLNGDSIKDKLLLLGVDRSLDSVALSKIFPDTFNLNTRPLIILIRTPVGILKQVARNDEVIFDDLSNMGGGDAFDGIRCDKGSFTIQYFYHGGGEHVEWEYTFHYSPKLRNWFLKEILSDEISDTPTDSGGYDNETRNLQTRKDFGLILFSKYKR